MFWLWFSLGVLILIALPFLRLLIKRLMLAGKLKKALKEVGGQRYFCHRLWLFSSKKDARCDFCVKVGEKTYAVKLFTVLFRLFVLTFSKESYEITYHIPMFSRWGSCVTSPFSGKAKPLPTFAPADVPEGAGEIIPVLLVHPACFELKRRIGVRETEIAHVGDRVGDWEVQSLRPFLEKIGRKE